MSGHDLKQLLDQVPDTREVILRRASDAGDAWNVAYDAWSDAHEEADDAYGQWRVHGGAVRYATYRAAQDREDAAQDTLSAESLQVAA